MKCVDEGLLHMYLDGECGYEEFQNISQHLETCAICQARFTELSELENWTREKVERSFLSSPHEVKVDTEAAWQRFSQQINQQNIGKQDAEIGAAPASSPMNKRSWSHMNKRTKQWITGVSTAAAVAVALSIPQVQVAAKDLLSIFRVDKVAFVKVTAEDLQHAEMWLSSGKAGELELNGIGKISIDDSDQNGDGSVWYESKEEAEKAGVQLPELPSDVSFNGVDVHAAHRVQFEIDTEKANRLLEQVGMDKRFDDQLNGKPFSLQIPQTMNLYLKSGDADFTYNVVEGLKLQAPAGVDLAELRDTVLALPFIPENVKKQMVNLDDWQHTLPLPYIEDKDSQVKNVNVNGEEGLLIESPHRSYLIWQHNGSIHMLDGAEAKAEQLMSFAKKVK
ncbi:DUF4367 domain-containing protein [Brevibacillus panacihumi]|uniref:DUF4367 domain-containing protein n=1 Tax=Brevibacillus panacihumi TaxID=497735 RepID=UPI003D1D8264